MRMGQIKYMITKTCRFSSKALILGLIYLFNTLVLYIPELNNNIYLLYNNYYSYFSLILLILATLVVRTFRFDNKYALISIGIIGVGFINIQFNNLPIGEFFPLVWFLIMLYCFRQLEDSEIRNSLFNMTNIFFWCYLIFYSFFYHEAFNNALYSVTATDILNPNMVGTGIVQFMLLWEITGLSTEKRHQKLKRAIVVLASFLGIYMTGARAAAIFFIGVLVIRLMISFVLVKHLAIAKCLTASLVLFGYIFPITYVMLWNAIGFGAMLFGKPVFTGRERIWSTLFLYMKDHPSSYLFGTGKIENLFWHDHYNLHNSYLAFFAEYGLIVSVIFWMFLICILFKKYNFQHMKIEIMGDNYKNSETHTIINSSIIFVLYTLLIAYTETNYTYVLSLIYIAFAYGLLTRKEKNCNDT